jgi:SH3-like domain-containing protein
VGRAYYAAYGVAKQYAAQHLDFRVHSRPDDHERLPWRLINHGIPRAGTLLQELRGWRNACDYDGDVGNLEVVAASARQSAHEIIDELRQREASST